MRLYWERGRRARKHLVSGVKLERYRVHCGQGCPRSQC